MRSSVAIAIDGVLRHDVGHAPIPEGLMLYRVLGGVYNVVLLGDSDDPGYAAEVEHFCFSEALTAHSRTLFGDSVPIEQDSLRARQITKLRNSGLPLDFVVEADPRKSMLAYQLGVNVLHFLHAQYIRPEWRPDTRHEVRPWDDLVADERAIKVAKANDARTAE